MLDAGQKTGRRRAVKPVFVVTPARSGSTLLRYLLDSHPDVTCPPELNLATLLEHVVEIWNRAREASGEAELEVGAKPPAAVTARARRVVGEVMQHFTDAAGAHVFVHKSLTTIDHLQTLRYCYPKAPLIFLYRHPLDTIASGLEASQWGFNAFGFAPYAAANPGNLVAALANYWLDRVSKMLAFEQECTGPRSRIYYELMCDDPATTLGQLFEFLGLAGDEAAITRAFESDHLPGPGDYKIDFTHEITVDSIGRGALLPEQLPAPLAARIDEVLAQLDYPSLDAAWRGQLPALLGLKHAGEGATGREVAEAVASLLSNRTGGGLGKRHRAVLPLELVVRGGYGDETSVVIDADETVTIVERDTPPADADTRPRVRCVGDVLLRVAAGEVDFAKAVHDRHIRVELNGATDAGTAARADRPQAVLAALARLVRP
jgi:hypothetical protein